MKDKQGLTKDDKDVKDGYKGWLAQTASWLVQHLFIGTASINGSGWVLRSGYGVNGYGLNNGGAWRRRRQRVSISGAISINQRGGGGGGGGSRRPRKTSMVKGQSSCKDKASKVKCKEGQAKLQAARACTKEGLARAGWQGWLAGLAVWLSGLGATGKAKAGAGKA